MRLKSSVGLRGLQPELIPAMIIASEVYRELGFDFVLTSVTDSQEVHMKNSLHPKGYAMDVRTRNVPTEKHQALATELATRIGPQYDVVLESDHIHVEFDPKSK
jgi:hypothetical protein